LAFQGDSPGDDSWSIGPTGVSINIPGWPGTDAFNLDETETSTTSTSLVNPETSVVPTTEAPSTTTTIRLHPIQDPARITIPSLQVDANLIAVGIEENGDMEVPPFGTAAWYKLGPVPGASGPSVIVAHVDSKKGPDVFYRLKDIKLGEKVLVYDRNGDVATFLVDSKEQQLKTQLPVDRIWNNTTLPVLRLITCGGQFDRSTGHYRSNVIVYAHLSD
jgi:hypothetical protein